MRTVVVGLNHYHVTGWVESLAGFPEQIEIVGRYVRFRTGSEKQRRISQRSSLSLAFPDWFVPFRSSQSQRADFGDQTADGTGHATGMSWRRRRIERLAEAGVDLLIDKPGGANAVNAAHALQQNRSERRQGGGIYPTVWSRLAPGGPWAVAASR
ncbi:MAG: hypothetical protein R2839_02545 [Thermomicrobiales bacterium]